MPADLLLVPEAEQDMSEAYAWYESHRPGLGEEFLSCVEACLQRVIRFPQAHAKVHEEFRRALVRRFPYGVFYEHHRGRVTVFAVFHASQNPEKWRERLH